MKAGRQLLIGYVLATVSSARALPLAAADELPENVERSVLERLLSVGDEAGQPISDATVKVEVDGLPPAELQTDPDGNVQFQYVTDAQLSVHVAKPGYTAMRYRRRLRGTPLPERLEITLPEGVSVGGTVVDQQGNPIPEAEVRISVSERRMGAPIPDEPYADLTHYNVHTDADGRWEVDLFPKLWRSVAIWVSHPDYVVWKFSESHRPNPRELTEQTWRVVLQKGVKVQGVILDHLARPIAGAAITYGPYEKPETSWDVTHPNEAGEFVLGAMPDGVYVYVIAARGYTPREFVVSPNPRATPARIRLTPGQELRVRLVDENQQSITAAQVNIWGFTGRSAALAAGVGTEVDEDGQWFWDGMPSEPFELRVTSDDYMTDVFQITPQRREYQFTLQAVPRVKYQGRVIDEASGKVIERFSVHSYSGGQPTYDYQDFLSQDGTFVYESKAAYGESSLEIRADGYRKKVIGPYMADDSPVTIEAALEPIGE
jgi:hypothetical protein